MLRSLDTLEEGFREIVKKSKEECGEKLEEIRKLIFDIIPHLFKTYRDFCFPHEKHISHKYFNSLVETRFWELFRTSAHILFLSCNGMYRSAFDTVRYALESIVQALYIDIRHPKINLETKIAILKEVEDKREYHAIRLIDELEIDYKNWLKKEYKKLSQIIHPAHKQIVATISDMIEHKGVPTTIDCQEISKIYDSVVKMYDIFFFLFLTYFSEIKEVLKKDSDFIELIKAYNLTLLSKVLKVRLR